MSSVNPTIPVPGVAPGMGAIPPMGAIPQMGMPTQPNAPVFNSIPNAAVPQMGIQPQFNNQGAISRVSNGTSSLFVVGYIAAQRNAVKRTLDESRARKSFTALYRALTETEKNSMGSRVVLTNEGAPVAPDRNGETKSIALTNTYSMTAFRTFFRADGKDEHGNTIQGFDSIRQLVRYKVDMSENTAEFWVMKCLVPNGADLEVEIDGALRTGNVTDIGNKIACFRPKQLHSFVKALNLGLFKIISIAALDKAIKQATTPAFIGYVKFTEVNSKSKAAAENGSKSVVHGVFDDSMAKCSVRQLGLNDDGVRTDEVAYIVLRNNTTGAQLNLTAESYTNADTFKTLFGNQSLESLTPRKVFTKSEYESTGLSSDEATAAFKAAKMAEIIPYETNKPVCELWGLQQDKYNQLTVSKSKKRTGVSAQEFMESAAQATQAIISILANKTKGKGKKG